MEAVTTAPAKTPGPDDPHPQDGGAKRRQILDGARTVFMSDGFDGASMNDIARVAGVSKGTLYVYFESKEALFEALIREDRQQQAERLLSDDDDAKSARDFLYGYGRRFLETMTRPETLAQSRMVISAIAKFPRFGPVFFEAGPQFGLRRLEGRLQSLVDADELEIADVELAARQFAELCKAGIFHRAIFCLDSHPTTEDIERTIRGAVDVFMAAYGPKR
jgi:AcrR family transcriptional regulator